MIAILQILCSVVGLKDNRLFGLAALAARAIWILAEYAAHSSISTGVYSGWMRLHSNRRRLNSSE